MQVAKVNKKRKKKKARVHGGRREDNDPLRSFDGAGSVNLESVAGEDDDDVLAEFFEDDSAELGSNKKQKIEEERKIFTSTHDGTGKSSAGRNAWKERHKKGKFSNKERKSESKRRKPLGI